MPRPNTRLLESAALDPDDRALWRTTLAAHQGALRFLRAEPDG